MPPALSLPPLSCGLPYFHGGISGKVMQVVALPPSTTGQVQTVAQETKNCTWKISGRCWKVRHRHMPLWGGAMMQRFTTMAAAGKAFTSLDKMAVGDDSGLKSFKWPDRKRPRICVLGGGFGGLYTALRLDSLVWSPENQPQVLLIDQSERFVFKPLLYELLTKEVDSWEIAPTFKELLLNTSIQFLRDTVKSVQPSNAVNGKPFLATSDRDVGGTVYLGSGTEVEYDWLVIALGAEPRLGIVPGATENALPFSTLEDALEVDKRLLVLETARRGSAVEPIEVVIVGSGYCGVELAATVAERLGNRGHVKVVDTAPDIVPSAPAGNREAALKVLASRNVELILGFLVANMRSADDIASPRKPGSKGVILELIQATRGPSRRKVDGPILEADLVLWTVGPQASLPPAETQAGYQAFPLNVRGQADTDEMLRVKGHPRIFAIGDSAGTKDDSGRLLPATAQVAFQQADYAGWNLWAAINNRPLLPFRYQHLGEMMTLGTADAAVSLGFVEGFTLDGLLGHSARKLAYLYRLPTNDHKARVGLSWLAKSTISSISFLQDSINQFLTPSS
ncbi:unnamed protein product [Sphagnum jensenii]|uniref:FAD/NAD(P)-binding domain-containing protein n=1 Tax=Sphagnum jensenii TaxID=128206 RepID=A0ABP0VVS1_9BRYO